MGRNKIKIEKIKNEKNRNITYLKRKKGLIKKAMELSLLCGSKILMAIVSNEQEQVSIFCSENSIETFINNYLTPPLKTNYIFSLKDVKLIFSYFSIILYFLIYHLQIFKI